MSIDCALLAALPKELAKLQFHFRHSRPVVDGSRVYHETTAPNGLSLVGAVTEGMGPMNAGLLALKVIEKYNPKSIILVGIAGGMDEKINLGDVVISNQIVDYEMAKITPSGPEFRWSVYPVDPTLINKTRNYNSSAWTQYIRTPRPDNRESGPSVHTGVYLSGNKVIASEKEAGTLRSFWRNALAIEMEASGIAAALRQTPNPPGFIVIKSICDYADSKKNDDWQSYSADAAASFAYSFILDQFSPEDFMNNKKPAQSGIPVAYLEFEGLRLILSETYNISELKVLCFDLGIDWEEISGKRKSEKIIDLIQYLKRRNKLNILIEKINRERDNVLQAYAQQ